MYIKLQGKVVKVETLERAGRIILINGKERFKYEKDGQAVAVEKEIIELLEVKVIGKQ